MNEREWILQTLSQIADSLVRTFPRHLEVVVHDLSDPRHSIRHIAGDVTRRKAGGPLTDLVVRALRREGREIRDRYNYRTTTRDGRVLKSTTTFIRDRRGEIVAAFCVNFDTTDYRNAAQALEIFSTAEASFDGDEKIETFATSIHETIEALFEQTIARIGKQPPYMSTPERIDLLRALEENGVFRIKGSVDQVARRMGISKYTVYGYLKKIRLEQALPQP
ncbi:MAG: PAS domain-containing protein [Desulfobacterales bacterium]